MTDELLEVSLTPVLPYRHAVGAPGSHFLLGLREGVIFGGRCLACGLVQVPPHVVCARCYEPAMEMVEVGPRGTLMGFTVLTFPFLDPFTGEPRPMPYAYGMIKFDGADNTFQYFIEETDPARLRIGSMVEAVFAPRRYGRLTDLKPFRSV